MEKFLVYGCALRHSYFVMKNSKKTEIKINNNYYESYGMKFEMELDENFNKLLDNLPWILMQLQPPT